MHPNISFSCLEHNSCGNKRSRRAAASATRGWHDDSLPGAGFLYNTVPLDSVGWHGDPPPEAGFPVRRESGGGQRIFQVFNDSWPRSRLLSSEVIRLTDKKQFAVRLRDRSGDFCDCQSWGHGYNSQYQNTQTSLPTTASL